MALFGGSNKKSYSTTNFVDNSNVGASGGAIAAGAGARVNVTSIDPGAFELGGKALDFVGQTVEGATGRAFNFAGEQNRSAFDFADRSLGRSLEFASDAVGRAAVTTADTLERYQTQARDSIAQLAAFATESNKQSVQQLTENVFRYGAWALVGLALAGAAYAYASRA